MHLQQHFQQPIAISGACEHAAGGGTPAIVLAVMCEG